MSQLSNDLNIPSLNPQEKLAYELLLKTNQILRLLATENSLPTILENTIAAVESQICRSRGSILILDKLRNNLCFEAGKSLPKAFQKATEKFPIGLDTGACGKAAFTNQPVIVEDIQADPSCVPFKTIAESYNLKAAWSFPIRNATGEVLGTFCVYCDENRQPTDFEMKILESFSNIAGIAIQNCRTEETLRASEERYKKLFKQVYSIMGVTSASTGIVFIRELVRSLVKTLDVPFAFVGEYLEGDQPSIRTLDYWENDHPGDNFEYKIDGTPCERIMNEQTTMLFQNNVQSLFPKDKDLECLNVESYAGICLADEGGMNLGILVVMDTKPMTDSDSIPIILSVFASRVKAELIRIRIEEEMTQAKLQSEKNNEAKSEFLARMSHELRTPMNAILGFSQLMEIESGLSEEQTRNVTQITKAGRHLLELINEVLDLSKIDSGSMSFSLENISIRGLINEVASLFIPLAKGSDVEVKVDCRLDEEIYVVADYLRLNQVLMNLVSNAIKYNRKKGTVLLSCEERSDSIIRILVEDTGPGIDPENLDLIFQPFERLEHEFSVVQGTGIGLTIAKRLIDKMEGELSVKSVPSEGSCFYIDLPKGERPEEVDGDVASAVTKSMAVKPDVKIKTILYIEDNPINIELIEQILLPRQINFVYALSGEEGIGLAETCKPDLILLDIHLPGMDGMEVFKKLRQSKKLNMVPVFALTANALDVDKQEAMKAGFSGYFIKPFRIKEFVETIDQALGRN